ncbi:hypothetical protein N2152v2_002047 [Parachlorella kessleri]
MAPLMAQSHFLFKFTPTYIQDIRNCSTKEQEKERVDKELGKIRKKYTSDKGLADYDKRKYMWKLLYTRMLGYDVDFGHKQAMDLIAATGYAEKQKDEFLRLVINSVRNDLISRNEAFQCLALDFVANVGGTEFAQLLMTDVMNILSNGATRPIVRKKAALCLLRLIRKAPPDQEVMQPEVWSVKLAALLEDRDLGVLLGLATLLLGIVSRSYEGYDVCVPKLVSVLDRLKAREVTQDYTYYGLASPWLQVKCLRVLQYFPAPEDPSVRKALVDTLKRILGGSEQVKNVNKNNAVHAIVFEAVAVAIGLEEPDLLNMGVALLAKFLAVREPNLKYLALENMSRLAEVPAVVDTVSRHQKTIIAQLRDPDVSIRRRALDLLFIMCNPNNAVEIVEELLAYLAVADFAMREELVLKTAVLAERFLPSLEWYVDSMLTLMERAGDFAINDLWQSVVQLVTNNAQLHAYAAQRAAEALQRGASFEVFVKCAGYLLGEYGRLLATGLPTLDQFRLLHSRFLAAAPETKAILLTAYEKMLVSDPDSAALRQAVAEVYERYSQYMDPELQQRAVEYRGLAERPGAAAAALQPLPKWDRKTSLLLRRLAEKEGEEADEQRERPAWLQQQQQGSSEERDGGSTAAGTPVVGHLSAPGSTPSTGRAAANGGPAALLDLLDLSASPRANGVSGGAAAAAGSPTAAGAAAAAPSVIDLLSALESPGGGSPAAAGRSAGAPAAPALAAAAAGGQRADPFASAAGAATAAAAQPIAPTGDVRQWFRKLCMAHSGILYEDPYLQVGVKSHYQGSSGQISLYFGNKHTEPLQRLVCNVPPAPAFLFQLGAVPAVLEPKKQVMVPVSVVCSAPFMQPPALQLGYTVAETAQVASVTLDLPVVVTKFCQPVEVPRDVFTTRWNQVVGPPFKLTEQVRRSTPASSSVVDHLLASVNLKTLPGLDPEPTNISAACVFHSGSPQTRQVPCMVRIEVDKVAHLTFAVTVATADATTTDSLKTELCQLLAQL